MNPMIGALRFTRIPFLSRPSSSSASVLFANKGAPPQTAYTYVEGGDYEDRREEIEALGGDPFFLDEESEEREEVKDETFATNLETPMGGPDPTAEEERYATDGKGPTPRDPQKREAAVEDDWVWDGVVDEDAHLMDF